MDIGRYTVLGPLGRGGMGGVYKVRHRALGRVMALKILQPPDILVDLMGEDAVRAAFLREARLMAGCDHPNVASVWDLDEDRGRPFMVLEYLCMNAGTLIGEGAVVEKPTRPLPLRTALDFTLQAVEGLAYLHSRGILHLDVKPGNMMMTSDGSIKLIDMGLSRLRGEPWVRPRGVKIGSPFYAAPEQEANPEEADERSDLYSAAVVLHRLATGLLPDEGDGSFVTAEWMSFFAKALARDPGARFQDAPAMLRELGRLKDLDGALGDDCVYRESVCTLRGPLRREPLRTGVAPHPFDFLDELFRPRVFSDAELEETDDGLLDRCTGLVWGTVSPWPVTWDEGLRHVASLPGGEWRMPTVEELVSLLRSGQDLAEFCHRPFGDRYLWMWTADRRSYTSAWFVDVGAGAVLAQDRSCRFHVRPVRSL